MFIFVLSKDYANVIDSLSNKAEVQKFLSVNLSKKGIIYLKECSAISRAEEGLLYLSFYSRDLPPFDTVEEVDDSGTRVIRIVKCDSNYYRTYFDRYSWGRSLYTLPDTLGKFEWKYYKADIDCNGHTDLVIDAGIVIIVMDMGDRFEGHIFSDRLDWNSYGFRNFLPLSGGTTALVLRHNRNPCRSIEHFYVPGKVTYITNTFISNETLCPVIDTLYKITSGVYSEQGVQIKYADTVDMKLYNTTDTIVYKFNGFTTYKPNFKSTAIQKITYDYYVHTDMDGASSHSCLEINNTGECFLKYLGYPHDATFSGMLYGLSLSNLWLFMSSIDLKSKRDAYVCEVDHAAGGTFAVYFDDGTVKRIGIWAYNHLPIDLAYLSKALSDASKVIDWHISKKTSDFKCPCSVPGSNQAADRSFNFDDLCNCY